MNVIVPRVQKAQDKHQQSHNALRVLPQDVRLCEWRWRLQHSLVCPSVIKIRDLEKAQQAGIAQFF